MAVIFLSWFRMIAFCLKVQDRLTEDLILFDSKKSDTGGDLIGYEGQKTGPFSGIGG